MLTRDEFLTLAAEYSVVPVTVTVVGDRESAVTVFEKLVGSEQPVINRQVDRPNRRGHGNP